MKIPKQLSEAVNGRTDNTMDKMKRTNIDLQNTTQKITHKKTGVNSDALEGLAAPAPLVTPIVLLITT